MLTLFHLILLLSFPLVNFHLWSTFISLERNGVLSPLPDLLLRFICQILQFITVYGSLVPGSPSGTLKCHRECSQLGGRLLVAGLWPDSVPSSTRLFIESFVPAFSCLSACGSYFERFTASLLALSISVGLWLPGQPAGAGHELFGDPTGLLMLCD